MSSVVAVIAVVFLAMGVYALAVPARVLAVFGVPVLTVDGRNEVRAVYGGYGVAVCVVLLVALAIPSLRSGILVCQAAGVAGMAIGRIVAAVVDHPPGFYPWLFCGLEVVAAAVLFAAA